MNWKEQTDHKARYCRYCAASYNFEGHTVQCRITKCGIANLPLLYFLVIKTTFKRRENDVFTRKRSCEIDV